MSDLVTVADVQRWLLHTMDAAETQVCEAAISYLSEDARSFGSQSWTTPQLTPPLARQEIAKTVAEFIKNYDGFKTSSEGESRVAWKDENIRDGAQFLPYQQKKLRDIARGSTSSSGLSISGTYAYSNKPATLSGTTGVFVPVNYGGKRFPWE